MTNLDKQTDGFSETLANAVELARLLQEIPVIRDHGDAKVDAIYSDRKFYLWVKYFHYKALVWVRYEPLALNGGFDIGEIVDDIDLNCGAFSVLPDPREHGQLTARNLNAIAEVIADGIGNWLNREVGHSAN